MDELESYVETAKYQPLSNTKIVLNKDDILGLIRDLRKRLPDEIRTSQKILSNKDEILHEAKAQAESMVNEANRLTEQLLDEHEIMQRAYDTANKLIEDASAQAQSIVDRASMEANEIRTSAVNYTNDALESLQAIITHGIDSAQGRFDQYLESMKESYEIVTQNRNELINSIKVEDAPESPV